MSTIIIEAEGELHDDDGADFAEFVARIQAVERNRIARVLTGAASLAPPEGREWLESAAAIARGVLPEPAEVRAVPA